jgi:hypothetical protein
MQVHEFSLVICVFPLDEFLHTFMFLYSILEDPLLACG